MKETDRKRGKEAFATEIGYKGWIKKGREAECGMIFHGRKERHTEREKEVENGKEQSTASERRTKSWEKRSVTRKSQVMVQPNDRRIAKGEVEVESCMIETEATWEKLNEKFKELKNVKAAVDKKLDMLMEMAKRFFGNKNEANLEKN